MARPPAAATKAKAASANTVRPRKKQPTKWTAQPTDIIHLATTDEDDQQDQDDEMEEVELSTASRNTLGHNGGGEDELDMEEVDIRRPTTAPAPPMAPAIPDYSVIHKTQDDVTVSAGEEVDDRASTALVFHDGKGQATPLSLTFDEDRQSKSKYASKKKRTNVLTPRDRAVRLDTHKLHVVALLAHAKLRNRWLNDEDLRDHLYNMSPPALRQKLRSIHPKKVPEQRERVRLFESFMGEMVRWWAARFYLDPDQAAAGAIRQPDTDLISGAFPLPGMRVDGWLMESSAQRERRHETEARTKRKAAKEAKQAEQNSWTASASSSRKKGKARAHDTDEEGSALALLPGARSLPTVQETRRLLISQRRKVINEITIFPPGSEPASRPALLRLLQAPEPMRSPADLFAAAEAKSGSRETSAQLFCALCRALGIPARLVISPQVAPWSIGAGKVSQSVGAVEAEIKGSAAAARGKGKAAKVKSKKIILTPESRFSRRGSDDGTSEDFDFEDGLQAAQARASNTSSTTGLEHDGRSRSARRSSTRATGSSSRPVSVASTGTASAAEDLSDGSAATPIKVSIKGKVNQDKEPAATVILDDEDGEAAVTANGSANRKAKAKGKTKPKKGEDYRDAKWQNLSAPLAVEHTPKLRVSKPQPTKETALESSMFDDVSPIDLASPPTMWVEVFSKPFQRWLTVDPIRARMIPIGNRQMEPLPQDRSNKLVYVVAFEEDGYARDVTARYTKTLHSRVSRMRPPPSRSGEEWWEGVVRALHRPQRLERDVVEDAELEEAASKEPMPNSVGGFKDHPVFTLERHLRRDEVLHPRVQVGTFQGIPVFHRRNVITLRSARQWYSEGRIVRQGEEAMKWVKSRGYTLANKRAEEQARAEGGEDPTEGLYSRHQTDVYEAPAVVDGIVPKNHFGNIDLFVPSMLPRGAAHIPHNGSAKIAKKLNVNYAEAIVGFEFRKHRSMPKMKGIVVPEEAEEMVLEAYWENEQLTAQKELSQRTERALRHWRKLLNALRIAKRVQKQYGKSTEVEMLEPEPESERRGGSTGGGFIADDGTEERIESEPPSLRRLREEEERDHQEAPGVDSIAAGATPRRDAADVEQSKMAAKLHKYGSGSRAHPVAKMGPVSDGSAAPISRLRIQNTPDPDDDESRVAFSSNVVPQERDREENDRELVDLSAGQILSLDELARLEESLSTQPQPRHQGERGGASDGDHSALTGKDRLALRRKLVQEMPLSSSKKRRVVVKPLTLTVPRQATAQATTTTATAAANGSRLLSSRRKTSDLPPPPPPHQRGTTSAVSATLTRGKGTRRGRGVRRRASTSEEDEAFVEGEAAAGRDESPRRRRSTRQSALLSRALKGRLREVGSESESESEEG